MMDMEEKMRAIEALGAEMFGETPGGMNDFCDLVWELERVGAEALVKMGIRDERALIQMFLMCAATMQLAFSTPGMWKRHADWMTTVSETISDAGGEGVTH